MFLKILLVFLDSRILEKKIIKHCFMQGWGEYWTYEYEYWKISTRVQCFLYIHVYYFGQDEYPSSTRPSPGFMVSLWGVVLLRMTFWYHTGWSQLVTSVKDVQDDYLPQNIAVAITDFYNFGVRYCFRNRNMLFLSFNQAGLWMVRSVHPSVHHTFFTMLPSPYHHEIFRSFYNWQQWCPCKRSRSEVKGHSHRGQNPIQPFRDRNSILNSYMVM